MNISDEWVEDSRRHMAALFRLLARFDLHEGIDNHCSLLLPDDTILINRFGVHWSRMKSSDVLRVDSAGRVISGKGRLEATAQHIHGAIHRRCPHAKVVVHTHMPHATAITCIQGGRLEPISQNALRYYGRIAYDGAYGGFADNSSEGERIASLLGEHRVAMLSNHGVIVTAPTVGIAFNDTYFLERSAQLQILASQAGRPFQPIDPEVCALTAEQMDAIDADKETHFEVLRAILEEEDPSSAFR